VFPWCYAVRDRLILAYSLASECVYPLKRMAQAAQEAM
jgi:hypothetical protein